MLTLKLRHLQENNTWKNILSNAIKWGKYIIKIHSLHYHQITKCGHELQQSEKGNMYLFDGTKRVKDQTDGSAGK